MGSSCDRPAQGCHDALGSDWFAVAVREHSPAVHAYLARRAGRQTADELLAEVWLRAFRSRHNLDPAWNSPGHGYTASPATL
jgi:DNA-directed RNA polymerase specialized sigma24 family protein